MTWNISSAILVVWLVNLKAYPYRMIRRTESPMVNHVGFHPLIEKEEL